MEVQIISRETIKPSSPTPFHLRTHKLSLLDDLAPPVTIPLLLFYSATHVNPSKTNLQLKQSLSKTLTHIYTFAGCLVHDSPTIIDCNDEGATFIEAQVAINMSVILQEAEFGQLLQLLPPCEENNNLGIQVNYFACGGMAICVCVSHAVADASAVAAFLQSWAAVACGINNNIADYKVIFDCSSVFPPRDLSGLWKALEETQDLIFRQDVVTKRFLFDGSKISLLRDEISKLCPISPSSLYFPTRFEAVSALLWKAMLDSVSENDQSSVYIGTSVNLRKRRNLPFLNRCVGNVSEFTMTELLTEEEKNLSYLAMKIHDSIAKVDDEHVKKLHEDGEYLKIIETAMKGFGKQWMFSFSSWCRFPFYETDFGWGNPIWVGTSLRLNRVGFFLDSFDGKGIEAWLTLPPEEMLKLEQDSGMLAFATFTPTTSQF
ncbi:Transferase [Corchorus olitorius]|uniref:Transferase n=1 Tax=Corchorus olitorius TaxID=93759 RepID=A0A1R3H0M6_9ROSI|nr:Transferase [Corchorus olitorius]